MYDSVLTRGRQRKDSEASNNFLHRLFQTSFRRYSRQSFRKRTKSVQSTLSSLEQRSSNQLLTSRDSPESKHPLRRRTRIQPNFCSPLSLQSVANSCDLSFTNLHWPRSSSVAFGYFLIVIVRSDKSSTHDTQFRLGVETTYHRQEWWGSISQSWVGNNSIGVLMDVRRF